MKQSLFFEIASSASCFATLAVGLLAMTAHAQPVSSTELIEKAKEYNNTVVEYEGEAVGDVMARGEFAWVNINDGANAVGIWGNKAQINDIVKCKGDYKCKGDIINIKGAFHRACPEHGGDLDIHMQEAVKIKDGFCVSHPAKAHKMAWAFGLSIVALGLAILYALKSGKK